MKKQLCLCLAALMIFLLAACGETPDSGETTTLPPTSEFEGDMDVVDETQYPVPPEPLPFVTADFIEQFGEAHYIGEPSDYQVSIGFYAETNWKSFTFSKLVWETETYTVEKELFTGSMEEGQTFVAQVTFWGDMTTYGITVTDENDEVRHYAVYTSGMDGSLILEEYIPQ